MYDYNAAKAAWRELNKKETTIPLYMKDWYWDAVCDDPDEWKVICIWENKRIEAAFPFLYTKRKGMWFIELPWQVAEAGIWLRNPNHLKKGKALTYLTNMVNEVIKLLPKYDCFRVRFNSFLWTWHPFYWQGFTAEPLYTSVISPEMCAGGGNS